jgi:formiminotetrahydrofolate cyclodeaminase
LDGSHDVDDTDENDGNLENRGKIQEKDQKLNQILLKLYENTEMFYRDIEDAIGIPESTVGDKILRMEVQILPILFICSLTSISFILFVFV